MISRWHPLVLFVVVLTPALLHAQQGPSKYTYVRAVQESSHSSMPKMYEDIEILRRILDRKLSPLYPRTNQMLPMMGGIPGVLTPGYGGLGGMPGGMMGGMMGMQGGMMGMAGMTQTVHQTLEGVYLKGQGVVYTATLSSLQPGGKAETPRPAPVGEWERVRRQVRNEKEEAKKTEASKPLELSDVLLKILAENGHHFSQLGDNESLTLVITVHDASRRPTPRNTGGGGGSAKAGSQPKAGSEERPPSSSNFVRNWEALGDLHMKQGRYDEAIKEYQKLVKIKHNLKQTYRKLAQCYLYLEKTEEARAVLEKYSEYLKGAKDLKDKPAAAQPAVSLPVKLIVSAPKKLLDLAGEKKITFEEFRRKASAETLRFGEPRR